MTGRRTTRRAATAAVLAGGRELSTAVVLFHARVAERAGLNASDTKTLELLGRFGPLTAGELATKSGLAPPSITSLVKRLEKRGYVRRVGDPEDGRRVRVELRPESLGAMAEAFAPLVHTLEDLCESFSVAELDAIGRFLSEAAVRQHAAAIDLGADPD